MKLHWLTTASLADIAANHLTRKLATKPTAAIALPTGETPLALYRCLAERRQAGTFACDQARFFNLDEFVGLGPQDSGSYGAYVQRHIATPLGIDPAHLRLLRGDAPDLAAECRAFDQAIQEAGGLDLAILGIGTNGHIAFNEPGTDWQAPTHRVTLAEATRQAQRSLYADVAAVPREGLTMGIATIRAARSILLLAAGQNKRQALDALLAGRPEPAWPVTAILDHPDLTILADQQLRAAA